MKLIFFSDTHGKHRGITLPEADIHIFTGDCTSRGNKNEVIDFLHWFKTQPSKHKIMIAGNHDFFFEEYPEQVRDIIPENIHYLEDSGIEIEGIKFWGSPITPWFNNWAFNRLRGAEIKLHWDKIPNDTDILLVHGPPKGILDKILPKFQRFNEDPNVGCVDLLDAINRIQPKIVAFGHIHEEYGSKIVDNVWFINSSILNDMYQITNPPVEFMYYNNSETIYTQSNKI